MSHRDPEEERREHAELRAEVFRLNDELAVLVREKSWHAEELRRVAAEREQALEDLRASHWHIRRIQELLTICASCGTVKPDDEWVTVSQWLEANGLLVSHGLCARCLEHELEALEADD